MLLEPDILSPALVLPAGAEFGGPLTRPVLAPGGAPLPAVVLATLNTSSASAASLAPPAVIAGVGTIGAGVAVTRAQTPTGATVGQQQAGGLWVEVAADQPRYDLPLRRLRVDGARTNLVADARTVGRTGWTLGAMASAVASTGPDGGAATGTLLTEDTTTATHRAISALIAVTSGLTYSVGVMAQAGSHDLIQIAVTSARFGSGAFVNVRLTGDGVFERIGAGALNAQIRVSGGWYWISFDAACTSTGNSQVLPAIITNPAANHSATHLGTSRTIRVAWANFELGARPSLPILPASGSPASATRGVDVPTWTPSPMPARGAIVLRGTADVVGAAVLGMLQLDSGTDSNRIVARIAASGQPECLVITSGVTLATLTPSGVIASGAEWRAIVAWSPGAVRFGTTSGGVVSASVAAPPSLSRGLLGHANAAGTLPLGGEIAADLYSYWPSEAEALALLTA